MKEWHHGCRLCFHARCYDYISANCTRLLSHTDGPLRVGGIKTENTLHSSTAYRTQTACHWHITAFGKQTMPAVIFANGFAKALDCALFVTDGASCRRPEQGGRWAPSHPPRLQSNLASWPLAPGFMSAMKHGYGRRPRTLKPARCHKRTYLHGNLRQNMHEGVIFLFRSLKTDALSTSTKIVHSKIAVFTSLLRNQYLASLGLIWLYCCRR